MATEQLKLHNQLCFRLYTASRLITQTYEPYLKALGITYTQYLVLMVLWEQDDQPVNDIGKKLLLGINTTSPLIKRMEKMGLVARHGSEADKRQQYVYLTPQGKALEKKAASVPDCMIDTLQGCGVNLQGIMATIPALDNMIAHLSERESL